MANDTTETGAPQDTTPPRRRRAPTIEATATEIAVTPIADSTPSEPDTVVEAAAPPEENPPESAISDAGAPPDEPPVGPPDEPPVGPPDEPAQAAPSSWRPALAGAVAAVVVVAVAGAAAYGLRPRDSTPEILSRLTQAEARVADLAARPASAATAETIAAMTARIAKIEAATAATGPATGGSADISAARLTATEAAIKILTERSEALDQRLAAAQKSIAAMTGADTAKTVDKIADKIADLDKRIAAAAAAIQDTRAALAAVTEPPHLKAVRLAVLAQALDAAVGRGAPYADALAAVRALAPNEAALTALAPFAASGLPSPAALAAELAQLAPKLNAAANPQAADSILAKFTANAEKIVRIRPSGDAAGDDAGAALARMEMKASRGDLAGSLAEAQKLPDAARALADAWLKRVREREAAHAAATKLFASALAAVATDKGPAR